MKAVALEDASSFKPKVEVRRHYHRVNMSGKFIQMKLRDFLHHFLHAPAPAPEPEPSVQTQPVEKSKKGKKTKVAEQPSSADPMFAGLDKARTETALQTLFVRLTSLTML